MANQDSPVSGQPMAPLSASVTTPQADRVVWGRMPYCNCLADSATANVSRSLQEADLSVSLQELSPRDGWLYFAVTFNPHAATLDEVSDAMAAGGAEVLDGPP
ncbi:MAG: hypothetical protein R2911_40560 [Caldilineaceae bacterium]